MMNIEYYEFIEYSEDERGLFCYGKKRMLVFVYLCVCLRISW